MLGMVDDLDDTMEGRSQVKFPRRSDTKSRLHNSASACSQPEVFL